MKDNISVLILAGGLGKRLRPLTFSIPKPMVNINGAPLISHLISSLIKYNLNDLYISTGYLSEVIMNFCKNGEQFGAKIKYINEKSPLGTAGPIGLVDIDKIKNSLLVINGDIVTNLDFNKFIQFHISNKADITVAVKEHVLESRYGTVDISKKKILKINEKPKYNHIISAGIYLLNKSILSNFPKNSIDMPEFINDQIDKNKDIYPYLFKEKWVPVEESNDIQEAELNILSK
jgi:NDP-sugar pyrophosphorylase family protein